MFYFSFISHVRASLGQLLVMQLWPCCPRLSVVCSVVSWVNRKYIKYLNKRLTIYEVKFFIHWAIAFRRRRRI